MGTVLLTVVVVVLVVGVGLLGFLVVTLLRRVNTVLGDPDAAPGARRRSTDDPPAATTHAPPADDGIGVPSPVQPAAVASRPVVTATVPAATTDGTSDDTTDRGHTAHTARHRAPEDDDPAPTRDADRRPDHEAAVATDGVTEDISGDVAEDVAHVAAGDAAADAAGPEGGAVDHRVVPADPSTTAATDAALDPAERAASPGGPEPAQPLGAAGTTAPHLPAALRDAIREIVADATQRLRDGTPVVRPTGPVTPDEREQLVAEGRAAGLAEGTAVGYARGKRAGRNEAKAAALVEARLTARRQVNAELTDTMRERVRADLLTEVRQQVRDELDAELREQRRAALAEVQATRAAAARLRSDIESELDNARRQADLDASELLLSTRREAERESERLLERSRAALADVDRREQRLAEREERFDAEVRRQEQRDLELSAGEGRLAARQEEAEARLAELDVERERVAGLTAEQAKDELLAAQESQIRRESALLARSIEATAVAEAEQRARAVVVEAVQRVAGEQTAESVVTVMHLPSDEMKGRIIGREGRNIRAFESTTGVNVIIDDTPEAVLLSCFDPVRREVGRLTLAKLVADGRIHPHRIEEAYERSRDEVDELCRRAAEDAVLEVGIDLDDVHPEIMGLLGRLRYRTSYGQNVLKHLVETAHIAATMAHEIGVDPVSVKRGAFLHDIGKALTHEVEGSHALIGADVARRCGESPEVVHAIEAHHNEVPPHSVEAILTQAADACSGGRPGARRESLETYVQRLERIEQLAAAKPGVEKVFAMQAGREIRVMVAPDQVDDAASHQIAREVAKQIEEELTYPGQIRVTVVRESRATEVAH